MMQLTQSHPAQRVMQVDGLFCETTGLLCALGSSALAPFMGLNSPVALVIIGIAVFLYGATLYFVYRSRIPSRREVLIACGLNGLWVVASMDVLVFNLVPLTDGGRWLVLILADLVGLMAVWQWLAARKTR